MVASATASPTTGYIGQIITVTGLGFGADDTITATFDGDALTTDTADGSGNFDFTFAVPSKAAGTYVINLTDEGSGDVNVNFIVIPTTPVTFTERRYADLKSATYTLDSVATEDALTIKAVYDVRDYENFRIRILNTHASKSLDYYIEGSIIENPDDVTPSSDWFTLSDTGGTSLTNIALANGVGANRTIDVSNLAYVRLRTENTTGGQDSSVSANIRSSVNRRG